MSIINVSGLTVLVGLVMQNHFFIISRSFCCLQTCDLFCESVKPSPRGQRGLLSDCRFLFFYCQTVFSCQLRCLIFNMSSVQSFVFPFGDFFLFQLLLLSEDYKLYRVQFDFDFSCQNHITPFILWFLLHYYNLLLRERKNRVHLV